MIARLQKPTIHRPHVDWHTCKPCAELTTSHYVWLDNQSRLKERYADVVHSQTTPTTEPHASKSHVACHHHYHGPHRDHHHGVGAGGGQGAPKVHP